MSMLHDSLRDQPISISTCIIYVRIQIVIIVATILTPDSQHFGTFDQPRYNRICDITRRVITRSDYNLAEQKEKHIINFLRRICCRMKVTRTRWRASRPIRSTLKRPLLAASSTT